MALYEWKKALHVLVCFIFFTSTSSLARAKLQHGESLKENCQYKAAVYEHLSISSLIPAATKSEANHVMNMNLNIYEEQVKEASIKGSKIIVFPEYGITGFFLSATRDNIRPFLEVVPNATKPLVNPCMQGEYKERLVQRRLSCLSKEYSIIIVAGMASMQPCNKSDPHCPKDGRYQFNTAVAYGPDGNLLAIYHKSNLYSGETHFFDSGVKSDNNVATFHTEFGTFGLFICFDILFEFPATHFGKFKVDTAVFPTAWMNELPLLSAVEYQQAWALGMNMNLLASNQHFPLELMTGSGIYSATEGAVAYHYDMDTYKGKLIVSDLPCFPSMLVNTSAEGFENHDDNISHEALWTSTRSKMAQKSLKSEDTPHFLINNKTRKELYGDLERKSKALVISSVKNDSINNDDTFISMVNHDPYTLKLLKKTQDTVSVSDNGLTCTLNYSLLGVWEKGDWYAFGGFSGLHTNNGEYYVQTCVLLRCASQQKSQCGAQTSEANTHFQHFAIQMLGSSKETFRTPEVLTRGVGLPPRGSSWDVNKDFTTIWSDAGGLKDPLLMAGIFGRLYSKD